MFLITICFIELFITFSPDHILTGSHSHQFARHDTIITGPASPGGHDIFITKIKLIFLFVRAVSLLYDDSAMSIKMACRRRRGGGAFGRAGREF